MLASGLVPKKTMSQPDIPVLPDKTFTPLLHPGHALTQRLAGGHSPLATYRRDIGNRLDTFPQFLLDILECQIRFVDPPLEGGQVLSVLGEA
jgi:hypothetical protein